MSIFKRIANPLHADAEHVYLPAARAVLEQGWAFLLTPESYRVVPLAYLWPALWGADPETIRVANMALWVGCVFFVWQTARLMGGNAAGAVAVVLWGIHPELPCYFATELTEPIFLFGLFGWIYAMARIFISGHTRWPDVALAGLFLTMTLLSRPVLQLLAPGLLLLCVAYGLWRRKSAVEAGGVRRAWAMALSLLLGLVLPAMLVIKNGVLFGLWGVGTGSGTGLYLGTHPLFQGAEPPFLGLNYDVNLLAQAITGDGDHLALGGDRAARAAAMWHLQTMSLGESIAFFAQKLWWWLMHHPAQLGAFGNALRQIRILEFLLVLLGAWQAGAAIWRHFKGQHDSSRPLAIHVQAQWFVFWVLLLFLGMLVQLLPILYNTRYSSALLDPWLILLAAFGAAGLLGQVRLTADFQPTKWALGVQAVPGGVVRSFFLALALLVAGTPLFYNLAKKVDGVAINPQRLGATELVFEIAPSEVVSTYAMQPLEGNRWQTTGTPAAIHMAVDEADLKALAAKRPFNAIWVVDVALQSHKSCSKVEVAYMTQAGKILQPGYKLPLQMPMRADGQPASLAVHANREMRPGEPGALRMVLHCPQGTVVELHGARLLESRHAWDAARHITLE